MRNHDEMNLQERIDKVRTTKVKSYVVRCLTFLGITIGILLVGIFSILLIVNYGPSEHAHKVFVKSVKETSAIGFLGDWFTNEEELQKILTENTIEELDTVTDTSLIDIKVNGNQDTVEGFQIHDNNEDSGDNGDSSDNIHESGSSESVGTNVGEAGETSEEQSEAGEDSEDNTGTQGGIGYDAGDVVLDENGIVICEVSGTTYKGHMMIVFDPSRVMVGVCESLGSSGGRGQKLSTIINNYGAVAGVNAGGFADENGQGSGAIPLGYVFSEGEFLYDSGESNLLIGFDENNILHVGNMSAETAESKGIRDAVTFGPALIINGEAPGINGAGSGLNPRTAIGQRSDGAVLLLVIDGRQANSLGASYGDLIEIFKRFGAVNAANLDGGSSSLMMYGGENISSPANVINDRNLPTAILVR